MAYVRIVRFRLSPAHHPYAQAMAEDLVPAIKAQPGCLAVSFSGGDDGECGLVVHWEGQDAADAAAMVIGPMLQGHLAGRITGPADIHLLRVLAD